MAVAGYCPICGQVMVIGAELLSGDTRMPGLIFHRDCYELNRISEKEVRIYPSLNTMPADPDEPDEILPPLTGSLDNGNKIGET